MRRSEDENWELGLTIIVACSYDDYDYRPGFVDPMKVCAAGLCFASIAYYLRSIN